MAVGVYSITNTINNHFYIGSSRRLSERKAQHNYARKAGIRGNSIIRNAVLKYGYDKFKFEVLDEFIIGDFASTEYIDELITSREQFYVDLLKPEYNIKIADVTSSKGYAPYKKVGSKNIISAREINRRGIRRKNRKKVDVYKTKTLEFVETVIGVRECGKKYFIASAQIADICKKGFTDKYQREFVFCYNGMNINNMIKVRKIHKDYQRKNNIKPVLQIDKNSNFIKEWRTGSDAEKELHLYKGSVSRVISGEYSHTKNYYFISKN